MTSAVHSSAWRAWPPAADGSDSARYYARAIGSDAADLDIDFADTSRPALISAVLAACVRASTDDNHAYWHWHIAERLQALLAVVHASGADALHAQARCPQPQCRQDIELELPLASFAHQSAATTVLQTADGDEIRLRLPTAEDQRRWQVVTKPGLSHVNNKAVIPARPPGTAEALEMQERFPAHVGIQRVANDQHQTATLASLDPRLCGGDDGVVDQACPSVDARARRVREPSARTEPEAESTESHTDFTFNWARDLVVAINAAPPPPDWRPSPPLLNAIGDTLAALDPLTALTLDIACPYCAATVAVDVDLEQLALARLRQAQHVLLDDVHRLAEAYHWSERDIVNLPAWRRAHYRARIGTEWP